MNTSMSSPLTAMNPAPVVLRAPVATRKSSKTMWIVIGGILLAVALAVGVYVKKKAGGQQVMVTTEKAVTKTIVQVVSATGKVQPEVEVKIAPEVSGEITQLSFREGAPVKKGDLLLAIKPDNYQAQVEQQEASLVASKASALQAKAQLLKAQDDLKRSEEVFAKKLIS